MLLDTIFLQRVRKNKKDTNCFLGGGRGAINYSLIFTYRRVSRNLTPPKKLGRTLLAMKGANCMCSTVF